MTREGPKAFHFETVQDLERALALMALGLEEAGDRMAQGGLAALARERSSGKIYQESQN